MDKHTPTQQRILDVLSDGCPHPMTELLVCLPDPVANTRKNVAWHLVELRKKLRPVGQDILCQFLNRRLYYRHVRLLASPIE